MLYYVENYEKNPYWQVLLITCGRLSSHVDGSLVHVDGSLVMWTAL